MFILTARLSRRRIILLSALSAAAIIILLLIFCGGHSTAPKKAVLSSNTDRIAYLQTWGWKVKPNPLETFRLLLPDKLEEPYFSYNALQRKQGFDLEKYCGKQVIRYTYAVTNYPKHSNNVQVNLYICENEPIAGDIISTGEQGFRTGLAYPGKK